MSQDTPFRTTVQRASSAELTRRNQQEERTHGRAFESLEDTFHRIQTQKHANWRRINSWLEHPDERVPLKILEARYVCPEWDTIKKRIGSVAASRADREEMCWTPLLDAIQRRREQSRFGLSGVQETKALLVKLSEWLQNQGPTPGLELFKFRSQRIKQVACRYTGGVDVRWMERAWDFPPLLGELAHNPATPPTFVNRIERRFTGQLHKLKRRDQEDRIEDARKAKAQIEEARQALEGVEKGPGLEPERFEELVRIVPRHQRGWSGGNSESWVARELRKNITLLASRIQSHQLSYGTFLHLLETNHDYARTIRDLLDREDLPDAALEHLAHHPEFSGLHKQMLRARDDVLEKPRVRDGLLRTPDKEALRTMIREARPDELDILVERVDEHLVPHKDEYSWDEPYRAGPLIQLLIDEQGEQLTEQHLLQLHENVYRDSHTVSKLIQLPGAGEKLWVQALEKSPSIKIREALAKHPPARFCDPVWKQLAQSSSRTLIQELGAQAEGTYLREAIQQLLKLDDDPTEVRRFIARVLSSEQLQDLQPEDLQPLLQAQTPEERRKALRLLGQVGKPREAEQKQKADRTGRSR